MIMITKQTNGIMKRANAKEEDTPCCCCCKIRDENMSNLKTTYSNHAVIHAATMHAYEFSNQFTVVVHKRIKLRGKRCTPSLPQLSPDK